MRTAPSVPVSGVRHPLALVTRRHVDLCRTASAV
ncbi:MAG TPA: putative leader peptide [Pseudonocardia sp.]